MEEILSVSQLNDNIKFLLEEALGRRIPCPFWAESLFHHQSDGDASLVTRKG